MQRRDIRPTVDWLRRVRLARDVGFVGSYLTDPEWLVDMAVNRRAGWPDDPSLSRGSCMPVNGKYPKRAEGDAFMLVWRLSRQLAERAIVRRSSLGGVPRRVRERIEHRLHDNQE